ncbi:transcriptional regulator, AsnC family protein, partial [Lacticaseibacillus rhamnosus MTCC 5462]
MVKLEANGVITGYTVSVNLSKLGRPLEAFVLFETNNCRAFREFCKTASIVLDFHRLAGRYSYLVHVAAIDMKELETFVD